MKLYLYITYFDCSRLILEQLKMLVHHLEQMSQLDHNCLLLVLQDFY